MIRNHGYSKASDVDDDDYEQEDLKKSLNFTAQKKKSYWPVIIVYTFYTIIYTIVIPALPGLALKLSNGSSSASSYVYGMANFARYISEFFAAPVLGAGVDIVGRKPMMLLSFIICGLEYALLAFFPSIPMLFVTRVMAGLFDSSNPTVYTIVTDLAMHNGDSVTTKFGLISALLGIGFVVGPLLGGVLCEYSISACFFIAMVIAAAGALATIFFLEETLPLAILGANGGSPVPDSMIISVAADPEDDGNEEPSGTFRPHNPLTRNNTHISALSSHSANSTRQHSRTISSGLRRASVDRHIKQLKDVTFSDLNPIPALILHFQNKVMRDLTIPLLVSSLTVGSGSIWYIYMDYAYNSTSTEVGIYLAVYGVVSAFILGYLIKLIVPSIWNEQQASIYGFCLLAVQYLGYGFSPYYWTLFFFVTFCTVGMISDPALKALIVKESLRNPDGLALQGNLQGVLCSIRTLATAFGSLIFGSMFAESVKLHPAMPYLTFIACAFLFLFSAAYLCFVELKPLPGLEDDAESSATSHNQNSSQCRHPSKDASDNQSLASGQHFRTSSSGWKAWLTASTNVSRENLPSLVAGSSFSRGPQMAHTPQNGPLTAASINTDQHNNLTGEESKYNFHYNNPRSYSQSGLNQQHRRSVDARITSIDGGEYLVGIGAPGTAEEELYVMEDAGLFTAGMMGGYPAPLPPVQTLRNSISESMARRHSTSEALGYSIDYDPPTQAPFERPVVVIETEDEDGA